MPTQFQDPTYWCRLLLDKDRLAILGILAVQPDSPEHLAAALSLKLAAVVRNLDKLTESRLVRLDAGGLYQLDVDALHAAKKALYTAESGPPIDKDAEAPDDKVLRAFLDGERLTSIPASQGKRLVILRWLAEKFEVGVRYPERTVNEMLKRHHGDHAALRRYLVDQGLLLRDEGVYWRPDPLGAQPVQLPEIL